MAITKCCLCFDLQTGAIFIAFILTLFDFICLVICSFILAHINLETGAVAALSLKISGCIVGSIANGLLTGSVVHKPERKNWIIFWLVVRMVDFIVLIATLFVGMGPFYKNSSILFPVLAYVVVFLYFWFTCKALYDTMPKPGPAVPDVPVIPELPSSPLEPFVPEVPELPEDPEDPDVADVPYPVAEDAPGTKLG